MAMAWSKCAEVIRCSWAPVYIGEGSCKWRVSAVSGWRCQLTLFESDLLVSTKLAGAEGG